MGERRVEETRETDGAEIEEGGGGVAGSRPRLAVHSGTVNALKRSSAPQLDM